MKKTLLIGLITMLSLCLTYGLAFGGVSGACVNCHTMHNSQDGTSMRFDGAAAPIEKLLRGDCVGCHAQRLAFYVIGGIPQVQRTTGGTECAGGNFEWGTTTDANVHNVATLSGINAEDGILGDMPPGYIASTDPANPDYNTSSDLLCAGQNGCHGNRNVVNEWTAVTGGHHGNDSMLKFGTLVTANQGQNVASSYRFLFRVRGGEETSWLNSSNAVHNEYLGKVESDRSGFPAYDGTVAYSISELCAECHGNYHTRAGITSYTGPVQGPWLRHPTDFQLPFTGEYASITETNSYSVDEPVGRIEATINGMTAPDQDIDNQADIVICLSCHKAHGSQYNDILRFDYSTLSHPDGCLYCHTGKTAY